MLKHRSVKQNFLCAFTSSATDLLLGPGQDAYLLLRLVTPWEPAKMIISSLGNRKKQRYPCVLQGLLEN